jgi:hypothetical protein
VAGLCPATIPAQTKTIFDCDPTLSNAGLPQQALVSIASQTSLVLPRDPRQDDPLTPWLRQEIRNRGLRLQPGAAPLTS